MKVLFTLLIALALCITCAQAADVNDEHATMLLCPAVSMTAHMISKAIQGEFSPEQAQWAERLASTPFGSPQKIAIIELSEAQAETLAAALNTSILGTLRAFGRSVNALYSEEYASLAEELFYHCRWWPKPTNAYLLVLIIYENDLSLTYVQPNGDSQSIFLISATSVVDTIDTSYVETLAAEFGLSDVAVSLYGSQEDARALLANTGFFSTASDLIVDSVVATDVVFEKMLPAVLKCGSSKKTDWGSECTKKYLRAHSKTPEEGLAAARFISERIDPIMSAAYPNYTVNWRYHSFSVDALCETDALPKLTDVKSSEVVKPNGTILALHMREDNEDTFSTHINYTLQSMFPPKRIPASIRDTDYILLITSTWVETGERYGITLYDAHSVVTLHDAKTGKMVMDLGKQVDKPAGFISVIGSVYKNPVRFHLIYNLMESALFVTPPK